MTGETSQSIRDLVLQTLVDCGIDPGYAQVLSVACHDSLVRQWGGTTVYIPAGFRESRDRAVVAAFTGWNRSEVCRQFQISEKTFYRILHRAGPAVYQKDKGDTDGD
jgi:Mor family transcriptional regulator